MLGIIPTLHKDANFTLDEWVDVIDHKAAGVNETEKCSIVRIKNGQRIIDTYVWQHDEKPLPENRELVTPGSLIFFGVQEIAEKQKIFV